MSRGCPFKLTFTQNRSLNFYVWHFFFFHKSVCQYHGVLLVEEIQNPILDSTDPHAEFMDSIS